MILQYKNEKKYKLLTLSFISVYYTLKYNLSIQYCVILCSTIRISPWQWLCCPSLCPDITVIHTTELHTILMSLWELSQYQRTKYHQVFTYNILLFLELNGKIHIQGSVTNRGVVHIDHGVQWQYMYGQPFQISYSCSYGFQREVVYLWSFPYKWKRGPTSTSFKTILQRIKPNNTVVWT